MRPFKKLSIILFVCLLTFAFSTDVSAAIRKRKQNGGAVGAPIDGGLLTILGAAGVSYYLVRKKKNNSSEI